MFSLPLRIAYTLPKADNASNNEDRYSVSHRLGLAAISDGASTSFDSFSWAKILVRRYCQQPVVHERWLCEAIREFNSFYDRDAMPWMEQAAFDKGTFASLLGIRQIEDTESVRLFAVGDTTAILCDGDAHVSTFPYTRTEEFLHSPELLSTVHRFDRVPLDEHFNQAHSVSWELSGMRIPTILCMTDALAHWCFTQFENGADPIGRLHALRTLRKFRNFVEGERAARRMRVDDTTLLGFWK